MDDDGVVAIVVMSRVERAHDMLPKVKAEIDMMNHDGSLPPGVKLVPFYNRGSLIDLTTHTVLHNLIFGVCLSSSSNGFSSVISAARSL